MFIDDYLLCVFLKIPALRIAFCICNQFVSLFH